MQNNFISTEPSINIGDMSVILGNIFFFLFFLFIGPKKMPLLTIFNENTFSKLRELDWVLQYIASESNDQNIFYREKSC